MTEEQKLNRRFKRLLEDAVSLAICRGCRDPQVYIEGSSGLVIVDGPPHMEYVTRQSLSSRSDPVVVDVGWPDVAFDCDVGSW